jgi:chromosome partitioning protein
MVITVAHFKGGAGKTTTTFNIASAAEQDGQRVLLIDIDRQHSLTSWVLSDQPDTTVVDWLRGTIPFEACVRTVRGADGDGENGTTVGDGTTVGGVDVVAGDVTLYQISIALYNQDVRDALAKLLTEPYRGQPITAHYDYIIFDCPPAMSHLTYNAMWAADLVLSPAPTERMGIEGLKTVFENIRDIRRKQAGDRPEWLVLPTLYRRNEVTPSKTLENLGEAMGWYPDGRLLQPIDRLADIRDARNVNKSVFEYNASSRGADQYRAAYDAIKRFHTPA